MIPEAFKKYKQFITWHLVDKGGKKPDKVPTNPLTGRAINPLDPENWMDADTVMQYQAMGWNVGFVFTEMDPFFFLDMDDCLEPDGNWSTMAQHLWGMFEGCYGEVSHSGNGLHVFGSGTYPDHGCRSDSLGLEFYTKDRFVAVTGTLAAGDAAHVNQQSIDTLINTYFPPGADAAPSDWTTGPVPEWDGIKDDEKLIKKMLKSKSAGAVFGSKASIADL